MWILGLKGLSKSSAVYQGKLRITVCIGIFFFMKIVRCCYLVSAKEVFFPKIPKTNNYI